MWQLVLLSIAEGLGDSIFVRWTTLFGSFDLRLAGHSNFLVHQGSRLASWYIWHRTGFMAGILLIFGAWLWPFNDRCSVPVGKASHLAWSCASEISWTVSGVAQVSAGLTLPGRWILGFPADAIGCCNGTSDEQPGGFKNRVDVARHDQSSCFGPFFFQRTISMLPTTIHGCRCCPGPPVRGIPEPIWGNWKNFRPRLTRNLHIQLYT